MGYEFDVTSKDNVFIGEHKTLRLLAKDALGNPYMLAGHTLQWQLEQGSTIVLSRTGAAITIGGAGDLAIVDALQASDVLKPGDYTHSLWQRDAGDEAVLTFGTFVLKQV